MRLRVAGAVDLAHQVPGRHGVGGGTRRAVEAVHLPADLGRPARVLLDRAQGVEGHQGVVRADLHPQIAVAAGQVELVGGEVGQRVQGDRALLLQAGAGEEAVAEAEGDRQRGGARVPRHVRVVVLRGLARHQPPGRFRPAAQECRGFLAARTGREVEGDEMAARLESLGDARLMFHVEHLLAGPDRGQRGGLLGRRRVTGGPARGAHHEPGGPGGTEQLAPRQAHRGRLGGQGFSGCLRGLRKGLVGHGWVSRSARSWRRSPGRCRRSARSRRSAIHAAMGICTPFADQWPVVMWSGVTGSGPIFCASRVKATFTSGMSKARPLGRVT